MGWATPMADSAPGSTDDSFLTDTASTQMALASGLWTFDLSVQIGGE